MKKIITLLLLLCSMGILNAKVVLLDNTQEKDASKNIFTVFSDAYAACTSPGDTIYVVGSNTNYGNVEISKPVTIIGPGYFLSENMETQVNKKAAIFGDIELYTGSEGSIIKGISNSKDIGSEMNIYTSNITIENCYIIWFIAIKRSDDANISNVVIKKCYFKSSTYASIRNNNSYDGIWLNINISNNILHNGIEAPDGSTGIINGNLIIDDNFDLGESSSFEIHNNIILATDDDNITMPLLPNASVTHNVSTTDIFGTENNNVALANVNYLFVGSADNSTDGQYQLGETSEATGAGVGGVDAGPFGGLDPYRLSGLPNLPNIYELSTGGYVSGDVLNVHIKIKQ